VTTCLLGWMKERPCRRRLVLGSSFACLRTSPRTDLHQQLDHITEPAMEMKMETRHSTRESNRKIRPAHRTPLLRFLESFFWYINIPLAHVCWVVTMIDQNGGLTRVRLEEFWRTFKMPHMGLSIAYYMLSTLVLPLLSTWLAGGLHESKPSPISAPSQTSRFPPRPILRRTPLLWYIESFIWYINMPLATVCWVVTMVDTNGGLMGVRMEDTLRLFKMPYLGLSIAYYMLSFFVFPILAVWVSDVLQISERPN
jgi:hypothetical protein